MAALNGHWEVAHELIQEHGIEGCGGIYGGVQAVFVAAQNQHVLVMEVLTRAGVIDSGSALHTAARFGRELSLKSLLQQRKRKGDVAHVNILDTHGRTPLVCAIAACSPRITRALVDAGASTTTPVRFTNEASVAVSEDTPLAYTNSNIRDREIEGKYAATESQLTAWRLSGVCS